MVNFPKSFSEVDKNQLFAKKGYSFINCILYLQPFICT